MDQKRPIGYTLVAVDIQLFMPKALTNLGILSSILDKNLDDC